MIPTKQEINDYLDQVDEIKTRTDPIGIKKNGSFKIPSFSTLEPMNSNVMKHIIPTDKKTVAILKLLSI